MKDYGTQINYVQIGKADINYETGQRTDTKSVRSLSAVMIPTNSIYQQFMSKDWGTDTKARVQFLVERPEDLIPSPDDYMIHGNLRYGNLVIDDYMELLVISGVASTQASTYNVISVDASDQLKVGDGSN